MVNTTEGLKDIMHTLYAMKDLTSEILDIWQECSKIVADRLKLEAPPQPKSIKRISKDGSFQIGGSYLVEKKELQVTDDVLEGKIPLKGLVFRECLFHSLPNNICSEAKRDLSFEYSRQSLTRTDRNTWISAWKTIPSQRIQANLVYNSFELMTWIHTLGGNDELDLLIHEFICMFRYGKSLNLHQYVDYMMQRAQNIIVALSHAEVKIVDVLMKNSDASYQQVADITGLSESWVCTKINQLKRKYVLIERVTVPFSAIGLKTYHILLAGPSWSDTTVLLTKCPFLYEIRAILNGPWHSIARLAVPDNSKNIQSLKQMVSILDNYGIACDVSETFSVGVSNSFYHYNAQIRSWEIPWTAMQGWGHRIKEESIDQLIEHIDYPARTTDHYLDSIDIQILDLVRQGQTSTRVLRRVLSIGQNKLLRKLKKLRREGLIRREWAVYNIGLVERVALRATDSKTSSLLDAWSRELPRVFLRYERNRHLLMIAELPSGGSTKMMDTLRLLKWPVTISPLSSAIWGHWQFPSQFWDIENQRWQSQKDDVEVWLRVLKEECENMVSETIDSESEFAKSMKPRY